MTEISILGNQQNGQNFIDCVSKKKFLFSLVTSYTETCEIPGITAAGANPDLLKYTSPADAEFLHYGFCKSIDAIPMTPDGKPTPALLTKTALEASSISNVVINAGSKVEPQIPYFRTGIESGKNIAQESALEQNNVLHAIDYGRIIGRTLASVTDCLVIGESMPGGTTTALAIMKGLGIDAQVSSSLPTNPVDLKNKITDDAIKRLDSKNPIDVVTEVGDPLIPFIAGMISTASDVTNIMLAGGTQMMAVLAFANSLGFNKDKIVLGTTSYVVEDPSASFLDTMKNVVDIPILCIDPDLKNSQIDGLKSFSQGFAKEGVGAGGSIISAMLKTGITSQKLLELTEKEYKRVFTSQ